MTVDYDAPRRSPVDYDAPRRSPVDYDAPRRKRIDAAEPLDELAERRTDTDSPALLDIDEGDAAESYELPGADLSDEELVVRVLPRQADEFICSSCFLVHHRNRLARGRNGTSICTECA